MTCGECWLYACYDDGEGCHLTGKTCDEGDECSATPAKLAEAIVFLSGLIVLRATKVLCGCGDYFTPERDGQVRCATCEMCDRMDAPRGYWETPCEPVKESPQC